MQDENEMQTTEHTPTDKPVDGFNQPEVQDAADTIGRIVTGSQDYPLKHQETYNSRYRRRQRMIEVNNQVQSVLRSLDINVSEELRKLSKRKAFGITMLAIGFIGGVIFVDLL